jgi:DNA-binding protein YbaB
LPAEEGQFSVAELNSNAFAELLLELGELSQQAADLNDQLRRASAAATHAVGHDPSEQVHVTLTATGRIEDIAVGSRWQSQLTREGLVNAVLEAQQDAVKRNVEIWAGEINQRGHGTPKAEEFVTLVEPPPASADLTALAPGRVDIDSVRGLWYLLQDATDRLDALAAEAKTASQTVTSGRDPGGHITVTLTGTVLTHLELEEYWGARTDGREMGNAITAALRDGYATIDARADRSLTAKWPFPDLENVTSDRTALLTVLGLTLQQSDPDSLR